MKSLLLLVLSMVGVAREAAAQDAECARERAAMVETIRAYARFDARALGQRGLSERVLEVMGQTKRHLFIPERSCCHRFTVPAGSDRPRPDHIAAVHRGLDDPSGRGRPDHVVLEVGTGSGYQAAILARLARKVCTIEIIPALAEAAAKT